MGCYFHEIPSANRATRGFKSVGLGPLEEVAARDNPIVRVSVKENLASVYYWP